MTDLITVGFPSITYFDSNELTAIKLQMMVIIWCKDWSMRYNLIYWYWQGTADEDREFPSFLIKCKSLTLILHNKTYPIVLQQRELYLKLKVYKFLRFLIVIISRLLCGHLKRGI